MPSSKAEKPQHTPPTPEVDNLVALSLSSGEYGQRITIEFISEYLTANGFEKVGKKVNTQLEEMRNLSRIDCFWWFASTGAGGSLLMALSLIQSKEALETDNITVTICLNSIVFLLGAIFGFEVVGVVDIYRKLKAKQMGSELMTWFLVLSQTGVFNAAKKSLPEIWAQELIDAEDLDEPPTDSSTS